MLNKLQNIISEFCLSRMHYVSHNSINVYTAVKTDKCGLESLESQ